MGRPPCCDKIGVKKGPWTPEEDIILVSYIQEHGPGNWRAVPTNTGLLRCSKSCRLRWTNYLRPGIKRGNFTEHEEKMIIHLQALLGNRWAAIASYLPERTDNDIKNYWNTHLKKKLEKQNHQNQNGNHNSSSSSSSSEQSKSNSKGQWERRLQTDIHTAKQALCDALSLDKSGPTLSPIDTKLFNVVPQAQTSTYASSTENIARLLEKWIKKPSNDSSQSASSESTTPSTSFNNIIINNNNNNNKNAYVGLISSPSEGAVSTTFPSFNSTNSDFTQSEYEGKFENGIFRDGSKDNILETQMPFSLLEKWLLDDAAAQGQDGDFMDMDLVGTADLF
ncbi:hypothetical protein ACP275_09G040200 [Erythranthe tilingii]